MRVTNEELAQNELTDEVDDEAAVGEPSGGSSEEGASLGQVQVHPVDRRHAARVGVGVPEVEDDHRRRRRRRAMSVVATVGRAGDSDRGHWLLRRDGQEAVPRCGVRRVPEAGEDDRCRHPGHHEVVVQPQRDGGGLASSSSSGRGACCTTAGHPRSMLARLD